MCDCVAMPVPEVTVTEVELLTQTVYASHSTTIVYPADASTIDQMNLVEVSGTVDFWGDPAEDQYTENDGEAV